MKKVLLLILDGWGIGENDTQHNAIARASTPFWDDLQKRYSMSTLCAKEASVGLSPGHLSNSEVGHTAIGAGRIVPQSAFAIDEAIRDGSFPDNDRLSSVATHLARRGGLLHLVGMLSSGGVHSHIRHLLALIEWAKSRTRSRIVLHLFLDGRDMAPKSALDLLPLLESALDERCHIASLCGRAIGMDRAESWDRTVSTYRLLTSNNDTLQTSIASHIKEQYAQGITDEFILPARFSGETIEDNDAVIFFNFRADRMRQLVRLFLGNGPHAVGQSLRVSRNLHLASMANYDETFTAVNVLFPKIIPPNNLGEWVSKQGMKQLRVAETEKYAHVTYFLNGGQEIQYQNEERLVIPSLGLKNYAPEPQMSLPEMTASLVRALAQKHFTFIVCNIANGDMVGHSGDFDAAVKAAAHVDHALKDIIPAAEIHGYTCVITADHGNIEYMRHDGEPHTAHTFNPAPLIVTNYRIRIAPDGHLHQVAPTVLQLLDLPLPPEMNSRSLIR